jgi:hypothetical protein
VLPKRVPRVRVRVRCWTLAHRDTPRTRTAVSRVFTGTVHTKGDYLFIILFLVSYLCLINFNADATFERSLKLHSTRSRFFALLLLIIKHQATPSPSVLPQGKVITDHLSHFR